MALTPKQEAFCIKYVETGNASEAYRHAYNAEKMKPETIKVKASELLKSGNVSVTVEKLKSEAKKIADKHFGITVESLLSEFDENRREALQLGQISAANQATLGKAKLCGLDVYKVDHTSSDGSMTPRKTLDDFYGDA